MPPSDAAHQSLVKARIALWLKWPLFGQVILQLEPREVDWCKTAATDGHAMYYDKGFVSQLTHDQLVWLTGHEVLHVVLDHVFRRGDRDKMLWNAACLAWDTKILMADGSMQPIQRIVPGDFVSSPMGPSRVLGTVFSGIRDTVEYVVGNKLIRSTEDHKYASKEGFFDAKTICNTQRNGYILQHEGSQGVRVEQPQNDVSNGPVRCHGSGIFVNSEFSGSQGSNCESLFKKAIQRASATESPGVRDSILGRIGGWRRHDNRSWNGKRSVFEGSPEYCEHLISSENMACGARILIQYSQESVGKVLVLPPDLRLGNRQCIAALASISRDQAIARFNLAKDYGDTEEFAISWCHAGRSVDFGSGNQRIEPARFSVREGSGERCPVFDLVTEAGVFFAEGVLTHNCDYAVDFLLKKARIGTPIEGALYSDEFTDEMTVDQIYERLVQKQEQVAQPIDHHLDDRADEDSNMEHAGGPPRPTAGEIQEMRENIRSALLQSAQHEQVGNLPLGVQRMINRLLHPKMDWRQILRSALCSALEFDHTYSRPSRRYWSNGIVLPGRADVERLNAVACLDGSASVSNEMIADFLAECKGIVQDFRDFRLLVMTFDTEVYNVVEYTPDNADTIDQYEFRGGGGTKPSSCWNYLHEHDILPDRLLIFTDGKVSGDWGVTDYCETLFIIHSNPGVRAPYGTTIHYEN